MLHCQIGIEIAISNRRRGWINDRQGGMHTTITCLIKTKNEPFYKITKKICNTRYQRTLD